MQERGASIFMSCGNVREGRTSAGEKGSPGLASLTHHRNNEALLRKLPLIPHLFICYSKNESSGPGWERRFKSQCYLVHSGG